MKRYGNIFEKIYDMDNLYLAHKNARKGKTYYKEVQMVDSDPEYYLSQIQDMLKNKTYRVSEYDISIINDKGKERELMKLPYYPDRIIQWAIMLQIDMIFMNTFCTHSCASVYGRGIHRASRLVTKYLKDKENTKYCLKLDIKKYYPNVNHQILKELLRKKFKDNDLLELLDMIIDSYPKEKGIPIGSYLSQYFANYYLTYFDHWLKEDKCIKYVVRYMDDIVIFHNSKSYLHTLIRDISNYLETNLDLKVKENWQVFPIDIRGVDFVGYRHFRNYKLLRKTTCKRFKNSMKSIYNKCNNDKLMNYSEWCTVNSYSGWLNFCNGFRLSSKYIFPIQFHADEYYNEVILNKTKITYKAKGC